MWHGSVALDVKGKGGSPGLPGLASSGWEVSPQAAESSQLAPLCALDTVSVGDMPTACWIKKMGSNWILPFYFKFSWILMEWITAHAEWRGLEHLRGGNGPASHGTGVSSGRGRAGDWAGEG